MRVLVACGTRPEFVKLAPVVRALSAAGISVRTVATGQHHDKEMAGHLFEELGLVPDEEHRLPTGGRQRIGALAAQAETELSEHRPDVVLLLGDTNTIPAYGLAARRAGVPVAHLEAGLRSFNETSIEEVNRRVAASLSSLQLAPTELARRFLLREAIPEDRIHVVGNPVIDVLCATGVSRRPAATRRGALVTAHRATNVDDPERLRAVVGIVARLAEEVGPVLFPVHPRTAARLAEHGLEGELARTGAELRPPLAYAEMMNCLAMSAVVVTDSGGLQEEASYLGVPVVVLRRSTPRWEGVAAGTTRLVGLELDRAVAAAREFCEPPELERVAAVPCPYGDGHTSLRVAALLSDPDLVRSVTPREPDLAEWLPPELAGLMASAAASP